MSGGLWVTVSALACSGAMVAVASWHRNRGTSVIESGTPVVRSAVAPCSTCRGARPAFVPEPDESVELTSARRTLHELSWNEETWTPADDALWCSWALRMARGELAIDENEGLRLAGAALEALRSRIDRTDEAVSLAVLDALLMAADEPETSMRYGVAMVLRALQRRGDASSKVVRALAVLANDEDLYVAHAARGMP